MNCDHAQQDIVLAQYGELTDELLHRLDQHLDGCEDCRREWNAMLALGEELALDPVVEPSPNLLAASRMRLDEALDLIPPRSLAQRFWASSMRWFGYVQGAPALTVLLVGVGFLSGNTIARYQAGHAAKAPASVTVSNGTNGPIANVSAVVQTPDPQVIQVKYNRLTPETVQGTMNDPYIRSLLMLGTKLPASADVREQAVSKLVSYCLDSACNSDDPNGADAYRGALVDSLRHGESAEVRLAALHGLKPYVAEDENVRNAVLDTLMNDQSPDVRGAAISMLQPVQADSSVRHVLRSVSTQDSNAAIRNASFHALQGTADIE